MKIKFKNSKHELPKLWRFYGKTLQGVLVARCTVYCPRLEPTKSPIHKFSTQLSELL